MARKLTTAQESAMRYLSKNHGFAPLSGHMLRTFEVLHNRGLVVVTIETPVRGYVRITDTGLKKFPLPQNPCVECGHDTQEHEAACIHCGANKEPRP